MRRIRQDIVIKLHKPSWRILFILVIF